MSADVILGRLGSRGAPGFSYGNYDPSASIAQGGSGFAGIDQYLTTHANQNSAQAQSPSNPFPPINYTQNYISTPSGDSSGMTSTDSGGGSGLNLYLIIGLLAVAAFAVIMVVV